MKLLSKLSLLLCSALCAGCVAFGTADIDAEDAFSNGRAIVGERNVVGFEFDIIGNWLLGMGVWCEITAPTTTEKIDEK